MKMRAFALAAVAALTFSAASVAAPKTTGPGQHVNILVTMDDKGLFVRDQATMARGAIVTFLAYNGGKKTHNFALLGKKTKLIKPGKWGRFTVTLLTRGRFPLGSTVDKGPGFHGFFVVY
jgi:plastocyanin